MKISVVGLGYLGAVHAAAMASLGHEVVGVDIDQARVGALQAGRAPFFEPGFQELLDQVLPTGRLAFSTEIADVAGASVHFICVGTPQSEDSGRANVSYVETSVAGVAKAVAASGRPHIIVGKSTVPVGTAENLAAWLRTAAPNVTLIWNPEFLREGFAVADSLHPDRLVYGVEPGPAGEQAATVLDAVYQPILAAGTPRLVMDFASAQLVKAAANSFLAMKISFINAMAVLCDATGGDVTQLAQAIGLDDRIGPKFLRAGLGFGGGCLPKDVRALVARAEELGLGETFEFLRCVDQLNTSQRARVAATVAQAVGGDLAGKRIAVLGLAFKPNSDDIRDSPALSAAQALAGLGARVVAYDPAVGQRATQQVPGLAVAGSAVEAATGADAVLVGTEWPEFRSMDPGQLAGVVAAPVVVDGRNCLDPAAWAAAGWRYWGIGRHHPQYA
ncbi:MAG: UDP-glucose/GDP-mannose dehydrogenase family protein [Bifidobacteriaceae bacterium]|nr:UDP-glucose/GDP-mannose dehydrogenase family protein [Bifidobacteriaceae bacterium]